MTNTLDHVATSHSSLELSVVIPCLNEVQTLGKCIEKALQCMREESIVGEVVVADNGSTDGSIEVAIESGARVVNVPTRGYGAALAEGIRRASGKYVIMGDADGTYDFSHLRRFVDELRRGHDIAMGNRFKGGIEDGAMPPTHRYFGNPLLSHLGRTFFRCSTVGDFYCGLRGFNREAILRLELQSDGMEFALEMIAKAGINGLSIAEVPTTLSKDAKERVPHLRTYRDGWRSLRFFLSMSPHWVFTLPGLILLSMGLLGSAVLFPGSLQIGEVVFDYHTLTYCVGAVVIGYQAILLGTLSKLIMIAVGLHPNITRLDFLRKRETTEYLIWSAGGLTVLGIALMLVSIWKWAAVDFTDITLHVTIRLVIGSVMCLILASQTYMAAFFFSMIDIIERQRKLRLRAQAG